ncbi:MAG: serine/threonine protein kinase [Planctomycetaceae bacterium]|nr:serine/threonine protein kinase [Planctomycetaceae bacterium]
MVAAGRTLTTVRVGSRIGKFRVERRLGAGGFSEVFAARDTILGTQVALKIPNAALLTPQVMNEFCREARMTVRLDHPNILPLKDATQIDNRLVIVSPLGQKTLHDRMQSRIGFATAFEMIAQLLAGVAYAHTNRIIHCDIKPENIILFEGNRVRLADFGIAKVAQKTVRGAGTGTIGYMAPEQAMGKPSARSDVFSIGLIAYRMFAGEWPEWPFAWPPPGIARLRRKAHPELIEIIRRSIAPIARRRYADAGQMLTAWNRVRTKALKFRRK